MGYKKLKVNHAAVKAQVASTVAPEKKTKKKED